jgi:ornithine cyclodeaminase/alanine dehydrogenase-like protein (mu-crystallin family)
MDATLRILTDADVAARADMRALIALIERALRAKAEGRLVAPPRHRVEFGERGGLVFTVGGVIGDGDLAGFRAYETFRGPDDNRTQLVAVWNNANAAFKGIVVGDLLGAVRTGAIGGAAIRAMARADARVLALIGSGFQARTQAWAAAAVRPIAEIRVYSRSDDNRRKFAAGRHPGRTSDDMITLFCSAGLAGTEVLVADALLGMS